MSWVLRRLAYRHLVTDWTGVGRSRAELYLRMAEHELHGVSPSYEALCQAVAASETTCALLDRLPVGKRQPNLLQGAVRFLGSPVDDPATFLNFATAQWDIVADTMMTQRTQPNEPDRCATLLPLLASLPQPLVLVEVGASAALYLYPDRYRVRYTTSLGEQRLGDSQIVLSCAVTGPTPLPERLPEVGWRAGLDLNPLQANSEDDRRWLASLIWPEQIDVHNAWTGHWTWSPPTRLGSKPVTCSSTCPRCSLTHPRTPHWSSSTPRLRPTWIKSSAVDSPMSCMP